MYRAFFVLSTTTMLIFTLLENPLFFFLWVVAIILSLTVHEFSHALAGKLQGDPTAELAGRLTLNPLAHIDWLGFFLLMIAGFGWAKPTPYNPYNLRNPRVGPSFIALAGPFANILMVTIIGIALAVITRTTDLAPTNLLIQFFLLLIQVNVLLAVFNFIPIPPLDGARVLYLFLDHRPNIVVLLERYGTWFLLALIFVGGNALSSVFQFFYQMTLSLIF